jgi:hypothetical protein
MSRFRVLDTAGSELGIVEDDRSEIVEGNIVQTPDGDTATVLDVYDDEFGREDDVVATLIVDE